MFEKMTETGKMEDYFELNTDFNILALYFLSHSETL